MCSVVGCDVMCFIFDCSMLLAGETAADVTAISENGQKVMQAIEVSTIK